MKHIWVLSVGEFHMGGNVVAVFSRKPPPDKVLRIAVAESLHFRPGDWELQQLSRDRIQWSCGCDYILLERFKVS